MLNLEKNGNKNTNKKKITSLKEFFHMRLKNFMDKLILCKTSIF